MTQMSLLVGLAFLACAVPLAAATYHVAPGGDDTADGLTPETAWSTLAKASSQRYRPGDRLLLALPGRIQIARSPQQPRIQEFALASDEVESTVWRGPFCASVD